MVDRVADVEWAAGAPGAPGDGPKPTLEQYEFLFDLTTQVLAAHGLDEQLSLAAEALVSGLGYAGAAVALVSRARGVLRVRAVSGFAGAHGLGRLEIPLDYNAPQARVVYDGRPAWVARGEAGEQAADFLGRVGEGLDVLAIPLFGAEPADAREGSSLARRPPDPERPWLPRSSCAGVLYVGAARERVSRGQLDLLARFSDRLGVVISNTARTDELGAGVRRLQRERQWVESVMKSVADPIVLTNMDNEILLQNQRAEELFSDTRDASEGKRRALEMNDLLFSAYLSSAAVESTQVVGRDLTLVDPIEGSDIHFEVISTPALDARGERIGMVSIFRDVTDLRRANEELARNFARLQRAEAEARRERDRLDLILAHVGHPIAVCDEAGRFILLNQSAERLFQAGAGAAGSADRAARDNSVKLTSFISALASGTERGRQAEIELVDPETGQPLPMEITSAEVTDAQDQTTAVVSILHDLSEIRELERRRVEQQLFESEKLAAVGRLAASIAHEVNNPLEAIKNSLYLMTSSKNIEQHARFLEVARKETERVSHIIRQMLGFARRSGEAEAVDLNHLLEETLILVEKKMKQERVEVVCHFDPALPAVRARADQLRQVFLNLLLNAQQAIEGAGTITVRTAPYAQALHPSVAVEVSDTGRGIAAADLDRVFEPFFSTRPKGTGLGLWVTHDIVRHHGGRIEVESTPGEGTTFRVVVPVGGGHAAETTARGLV
ncbi:MAG TPA: ATP-binding protein [Pyrinomonadaceae bacterium]|nr:ATP-binding protein [Pyrinomonadaceae bacterium]